MNEFDRLEQQLRASTRVLGPAGSPGRSPWRRRALRTLLVAAPITIVAGAAGAAGVFDRGETNRRANVVVRDTVVATATQPACARDLPRGRPSRRFSDARPRPELLRVLPTLTRDVREPIPARPLRAAQIIAGDGAILRDSMRWAVFPDGMRVLLYVTEGGLDLRDPRACRAARLRLVQANRDLSPDVRKRAEEVLRTRPDTDEHGQALWMQHGGGAGGSPVQPGHPISTRRHFGYSTTGFWGIAHQRATSVRVQRVRPGRGARTWRGPGAFQATVPVVHNLYAFKGRGGTAGRYRIVQYDQAGHVVRRVVLP